MSLPGQERTDYEIVFLRHAQSTGNAQKRHQGQADFPLTEEGRRQAQKLADFWKREGMPFDLLITSPLSRATETAEILTKRLNIPVETEPLWMERDNGRLAGLLHEEAREKLPQPDFIPLYQPIAETGESQWELYLRAGKALNNLMKKEPGMYLVVGHGGQFNMVMHAVAGLAPQPNFQGPRFRFGNTSFTRVAYHPQDGRWDILQLNVRPHLE